MKGAAPGQSGFTLLEVLVALAILSLAVVASIQGFAQGLRLLKLSGDYQQAMLLADQKVREIVDPVVGQDTGFEGPFRWERATKAVETPELVTAAGGAPRVYVYEIDVRVNWDPRRQVEVRTYRMMSTPPGTTVITRATTVPAPASTPPIGPTRGSQR